LKTSQPQRTDLDEFVSCYPAETCFDHSPTWSEANPDGRRRVYTYDELMARDKANLDIFWLRDESLEDRANLSAPELIAQEISDDLEAVLEQIRMVLNSLSE
jgi:type I restriction enzyme M protein